MVFFSPTTPTFYAQWPSTLPVKAKPPLQDLFQRYVGNPVHRTVHSFIATILVTGYGETLEASKTNLFAELDRGRRALQDKGGREISLVTPEGLALNGMHFRGTENAAILYIGGNNAFYERDSAKILAVRDAVGHHVHLLLFNPRGFAKSQGYPYPVGMSLDVLTAFQYLVREGIDPSCVVIYGRSIGGGWGALGAALIQKEYPNKHIHMLHERSFENLRATVRNIARHVLPLTSGLTERVADVALSFFVLCGWALTHKKEIATLHGHKCVVYHQRDGTVPFRGSLFRALKMDHDQGRHSMGRVVCIELRDTGDDQKVGHPLSFHNRPFRPEELRAVAAQIGYMLGLINAHPVPSDWITVLV